MKPQRRGKLTKSRAVESPDESSSDEKSDDEQPRNLGSKLNLLRDKRKRSRKKSDEQENHHPAQGIAHSLKRTFGFFRRSERSSEDVEAAVLESVDTPDSGRKKTMAVVVDVHTEHEEHKIRVAQTNVSDEEEIKKSSPERETEELDVIEVAKMEDEERPKSGLFSTETEESDVQDEVELTSQVPPTSGGRRKRWDKPEISADDLVEDLTKPKRRQWATGAASAEIRKASGKKIVVPKRSSTAEPQKSLAPPKPSRLPKPIAAPRTKKKEGLARGFDNDAFSSDHDEVLRIETVNNHSPKIKISSVSSEKIEDGASTLSEEEDEVPIAKQKSIEEIKEYVQDIAESSEVSEVKDPSPSETPDSREFMQRKSLTRRRSSDKRKSSSEKRSEDEEEEDEELETVLDAMDKESRRSSGSSKIEIIPSKFFDREESSDETTISTNEEMHSSRPEVPRPKSRSRSKSKSSRAEKSDEKDSERSSRTKRKTTSSSARNSPEELSANRRRPKSRTKKRHKRKDKRKLEEVEEEVKYISIRIHRSDMLEADYITRHPMVKVHIVYADNGDYLKVKNKEDDGLSPLQPIISGKFDFKEKRSMVPVWEEELIFEMNFQELLFDGKGSVVVLFEIVDLLSFNEASSHYDQSGKESCWYKVAWAFLRPIGANGTQHINKIVRLQLYRPKKTFRRATKTKCEVYKWWKSGSRDKYPSSLYVGISPIDPPKLEPIFSEQLLQLHDLSEVRSDSQNLLSAKSEEAPEPPKWTRHAAQSCQIPNETYLETEASDNGCFYVAFSNDGKYLACALSEEYDYPILVYKIDEMKTHVRFAGHKNFIYSLSWSHDNRFLLSVSSDQTARFWDVREQIIEHVQSLPHPSYVYCGKFSPGSSSFVLTGCYDHVARIWARQHSRTYELVQELEGHESFVNAACIQPRDEVILTGDGVGVVIVWSARKSRRTPLKRDWQIAKKIKIKELDGVAINTILAHPLGSRLLIHSRNGGLRLLDMTSGVAMKKFEGLKNHRIQVAACISPCGGLLFCGGEDSTLNVWSVDSGKLVAAYEMDCSQERAVTCVDYHPYDHVLAFGVYGAPVPAKVLKYDREADGSKVGLKLLGMTVASMMSVSSSARERFAKDQATIVRNAGRNFELSARSLMNSSTILSINHLPSEYKDEDEARKNLRGKLQRFIESGPNLKAKSLNRLNGIIEKIDRILMYATSQKSQDLDVESARNSLFTVEEKYPRSRLEMFELQELQPVDDSTKKRRNKHRQRSRSARNALSPTPANDHEFSKAYSDSAAFTRKVSKFSDDSSNSNRSVVRGNFVVERLDLKDIDYNDTESAFKDSLDTIVDGKEDFPSEELLEDVESLKSDDTYVVNKSPDGSDRSNATFIIESEVPMPPVPKPRKRTGRIEVS